MPRERTDLFVPPMLSRGIGSVMASLLRQCASAARRRRGARRGRAASAPGAHGLIFLVSDFHWPLERLGARARSARARVRRADDRVGPGRDGAAGADAARRRARCGIQRRGARCGCGRSCAPPGAKRCASGALRADWVFRARGHPAVLRRGRIRRRGDVAATSWRRRRERRSLRSRWRHVRRRRRLAARCVVEQPRPSAMWSATC